MAKRSEGRNDGEGESRTRFIIADSISTVPGATVNRAQRLLQWLNFSE
jgi:hypothetical protein